jgi:small subunit ribosomal protein S17
METENCGDRKCPFHGEVSLRGRRLKGRVVSDKMTRTVSVEVERKYYVPKYERYERRTSKIHAHNPPCINARAGDEVYLMECRRLSKTKSFVVVRKVGGG